MSAELQGVIEAYGGAWNETNADKRLALLGVSWSETGVHQDPTGEASGRQGLCDHIAEFQARFPAARIELTSGLDVHHGKLRFGWRLVSGGGSEMTAGTDFVVLADDGRIASVTGFFGPLPPGA